MTDRRVYPHTLTKPLVLTADNGTPYVLTTYCEDDGQVTFQLHFFNDRSLADIFAEGEDVDDEIGRRRRRETATRAELPPDEPVSVIRVLEYRGPRKWVEETVKRSIPGTRIVESGKTITGVTVGDFPRRI